MNKKVLYDYLLPRFIYPVITQKRNSLVSAIIT